MADIEQELLQAIYKDGKVADSGEFASKLGVEHLQVVGTIKSLQAAEMITAQVRHQSCGRRDFLGIIFPLVYFVQPWVGSGASAAPSARSDHPVNRACAE